MDNFWIYVARPFVALVLFFVAALLSRLITRRMKDGKLKRTLLTRIGE